MDKGVRIIEVLLYRLAGQPSPRLLLCNFFCGVDLLYTEVAAASKDGKQDQTSLTDTDRNSLKWGTGCWKLSCGAHSQRDSLMLSSTLWVSLRLFARAVGLFPKVLARSSETTALSKWLGTSMRCTYLHSSHTSCILLLNNSSVCDIKHEADVMMECSDCHS